MKEYAIIGYFDHLNSKKIYELKNELYKQNLSDYVLKSPICHLTFCDFKVMNNNIKNELDNLCQNILPITLELSSLDNFIGTNIIYLAPTKSPLLSRLHASIYEIIKKSALSNYYDIEHWLPHVTIANRIPAEHYSKAFALCKKRIDFNHLTLTNIKIVEFEVDHLNNILSESIIHEIIL